MFVFTEIYCRPRALLAHTRASKANKVKSRNWISKFHIYNALCAAPMATALSTARRSCFIYVVARRGVLFFFNLLTHYVRAQSPISCTLQINRKISCRFFNAARMLSQNTTNLTRRTTVRALCVRVLNALHSNLAAYTLGN